MKDEVARAINDLAGQGRKPTLVAIHAALNNRGSMSTLVRLKAEIDAAAQPATDSSEGLKVFREVWALAVEEGRQQQEALLGELRESVKALAAENERLEGMVIAAQNRASELDNVKQRAEAELSDFKNQVEVDLKQARTSQAEATGQVALALEKLAEDRASHATQVSALQSDLTAALRKSHDLELNLVRAEALLGAKSKLAESRKSNRVKQASAQASP